jgi:hypothetical protein
MVFDRLFKNKHSLLLFFFIITLLRSLVTLILMALKPLTRSRLWAEKSHFYLTPCTALGGGGAFSTALKICLNKTRVTLKLSTKAH